jgi:dihydroorotate dehydrogenase electron transfer subunit
MHQITTQVTDHTRLSPGYGRIRLACGPEYARAEAGQFVMLGLPGGEPLLRRPFSIHRLVERRGRAAGIELLYKIVGPATRRLAELAPGRTVSLLGPLGRGFRVPEGCRRIVLAAGGVGVAPLLFLADRLTADPPRGLALQLFLGGRSREDLLCAAEFERIGVPVKITTDDGSCGERCRVTDPLEAAVVREPPDLILACGPPGMLACTAGIARRRGVPCQVSVETMMACGMGACLGCAVTPAGRPDRYLHACIDGPVFDAAALAWP